MAKKTVLSYNGTRVDGTAIENRMEFPKADACRIEGNTVSFLHYARIEPSGKPVGTPEVAYSWTLVPA
jgi:hypothetical protein